MALAGVLANASAITSVYAVEITALQIVKTWTLDPASPATSYSTALSIDDPAGDQAAIIVGVNYGDTTTGGNTSLAEVSSAAAVLSTPGSWYWDQTTLYIHNPLGQDPRVIKQTVTVEWMFFFATTAHIFDGIYYQPLLLSTPPMSLRVEQDFSGLAQVSGGSTTLDNSTGFFDALTDLNWDGGTTSVFLGADQPNLGLEMNWSDYEPIGSWLNDNWTKTNQNFTITNLAPSYALTQNMPQDIYSLDIYPSMDITAVGNPIPLAYGLIYGAKPTCIDQVNNVFKLASHAVYSIDQVRIQDSTTGLWSEVSVIVDLGNGQFTYSGYVIGTALSVDFHGRMIDSASVELIDNFSNLLLDNSGAILCFGQVQSGWMDNASDMVADLLNFIGIEDLDSASFSTSRVALTLGTPASGLGILSYSVPSLYLNTAQSPQAIIQTINEIVGSYLFVDPNGNFRYVVFSPQPGESLPLFVDDSILNFSDQKLSTQIQSRVVENYAIRAQDGWGEVLIASDTDNQYKTSQSNPTNLQPESIGVSTEADADYWAYRQLIFFGSRPHAYGFNVPWSGLLLLPSQQIHVQYSARNVDKVLEIVEVDTGSDASAASSAGGSSSSGVSSYGGSGVQLTLSNMHNFDDYTGFWVGEDGDPSGNGNLPTRFSTLAGYGTGSLVWNPDWDDQIKTWVRQNVGYWTDENGFPDSADSVSQGHSVWF